MTGSAGPQVDKVALCLHCGTFRFRDDELGGLRYVYYPGTWTPQCTVHPPEAQNCRAAPHHWVAQDADLP
jgi:hypothetical protein